MLALAVGLAAPVAASAADRPPQVIVAILPSDTTVAQIAATPGAAPGLLSDAHSQGRDPATVHHAWVVGTAAPPLSQRQRHPGHPSEF